MRSYYLNEDHTYRRCDLEEWSIQFVQMCKDGTNHVALGTINDLTVSTIWLGNDHRFDAGEPLLFETMVFSIDSYSESYCERYSTWDEAVDGHKKAIEWVRNGCPTITD